MNFSMQKKGGLEWDIYPILDVLDDSGSKKHACNVSKMDQFASNVELSISTERCVNSSMKVLIQNLIQNGTKNPDFLASWSSYRTSIDVDAREEQTNKNRFSALKILGETLQNRRRCLEKHVNEVTSTTCNLKRNWNKETITSLKDQYENTNINPIIGYKGYKDESNDTLIDDILSNNEGQLDEIDKYNLTGSHSYIEEKQTKEEIEGGTIYDIPSNDIEQIHDDNASSNDHIEEDEKEINKRSSVEKIEELSDYNDVSEEDSCYASSSFESE